MNGDLYFVGIGGRMVAQHMLLEDALILAEALFNKFYNMQTMVVDIGREKERGADGKEQTDE